jgi:hypothetical protein
LIKILKRIIGVNPFQWHDCLAFASWSNQTTTKSSTIETLFQLVYGQEAIMPIYKLEIASLKVVFQTTELDTSHL